MINAFSSVSGIMCVLIDAIITGQFLGTMAVIASGLITPIVTLSNLLCNLLAPGISIVCTRYMGKAQPERSCQVFSIVMIADLFLSGLYALILFAAAPAISGVLGQAVDDQIRQMMSDYMRGYAFSVANSAFSLVNAIAISVLITTATLCSLLFGEEDRNALTAAISVALRTAFRCFAVITAVMMIFAHIIVGLFLEPSAVGELKRAARFIRFIRLCSFAKKGTQANATP